MKINHQIFIKHAIQLRAFVLDLIFPIECLGCGKEGEWLCSRCFQSLKLKRNQYCLGCKKENKLGEFCKNCRDDYFVDGILIAGDYENKVLANLIKSFKYKFIKDLGTELGKFLALFLRDLHYRANTLFWDTDRFINLTDLEENLLIPVPLHKKRERWRGFNQADILLKGLLGKEPAKNLEELKRIKYKTPQAKLNEKERMSNIKNCFVWEGEGLEGKNVILIDDVVTTGATLNECARVLKENGARKVWGLVVAKG